MTRTISLKQLETSSKENVYVNNIVIVIKLKYLDRYSNNLIDFGVTCCH